MGWFDNPIGEISDTVDHWTDVASDQIDHSYNVLKDDVVDPYLDTYHNVWSPVVDAPWAKTAARIGSAAIGVPGLSDVAYGINDASAGRSEKNGSNFFNAATSFFGGGGEWGTNPDVYSMGSPDGYSDLPDNMDGFDMGGDASNFGDFSDFNNYDFANDPTFANAANVDYGNVTTGLEDGGSTFSNYDDASFSGDPTQASNDTPEWWNKFSNFGTKFATNMGKQAVKSQVNNLPGGRILTQGYDMYNGTPGINGNGGRNGGLDLGSLFKTAGDIYGGWSANQNIDRQRDMLQTDLENSRSRQNTMPSLDSMYGPNSPYALQLRQSLARRDAKAGRNSQYGPREAQLQAMLADKSSQYASSQASSNAQTMNANRDYSKAISDLDSRKLNNNVAMTGGLFNTARNSGLFDDLGSLFSNRGVPQDSYEWA